MSALHYIFDGVMGLGTSCLTWITINKIKNNKKPEPIPDLVNFINGVLFPDPEEDWEFSWFNKHEGFSSEEYIRILN